MKKSFHVFFLFVLFAFFAVNAAWAADVTLQTDAQTGEKYVNMPAEGTDELIISSNDIASGITSFKVYDDGGKEGNFSSDANGELLLSAPEGYRLVVTGSLDMMGNESSSAGFFRAYDGNSFGNVQMVYYDGAMNDVGVRVSTGNALFLNLVANGNGSASGIDFSVTVMKDERGTVNLADDGADGLYVNMPMFGTNSIDLTDYIANGVTSFKVYDNGGKDGNYYYGYANSYLQLSVPEGYKLILSGSISTDNGGILSIYDGNSVEATPLLKNGRGEIKNIGWVVSTGSALLLYFYITKNSVPNKSGFELSVQIVKNPAELTDDGENGYYVNMPVAGTNTLDLAEYVANGVTSFKVYDDGGKDGNFTDGANGYLEMTAPAGYQFIIQGSMNATCDGGSCSTGELNIFDGNSSATRILQKRGNVSSINKHSSGNTMTLYFTYGSGSGRETASGLDFTVSVITQHSVNIADVSGGKISTNKETADEGTTVTLTAAPDRGYILNSISVFDIDGKSVDGTWDIGANTFTFNMPAEAVFVTPLFVPMSDVFVNMPKTGNMEVVIPEGVESIKVYDDGGKDGNYSDKSNAILQLIAPENYVFQISGSVTTEVSRDYLDIYDGDKVHDNFLMLSTLMDGSVDLNGANILTSSNNVITIKFFSNDYTNKSGFDLKVTLVKPTYGAVAIAKADDGKIHATINGDYEGTETLSIPEAIEVDAIDYNRELDVETPVTALLPVTLPAGTTVNADFYTLEKVEQVEGMKWQATMTYIGKNNLPQPNTPYAVILPKGQTKLEFDLKGNKATVQTGKIKKVCGLSDCKLDENEQITDDWFFTGTYAYKQWNTGDEELGLAYAFAASDNPDGAAKGKFGKIKAGAFANATRCYLRKRDAKVKLQQQNQAQMVAASPYVARYSINNLPETIDVEFVKNDEKGGRTVLRGRMNTVTGEFKMLRDYDLKGRKVNGVNKARGAYYGKKVLKK